MPGIWEMLLITAFLAWMIVPFFMKKKRLEERKAKRRVSHRSNEQIEELDDNSYEILEDE